MLADIRHSLRLFRVARTLSRYNALFPLESLDLPPSIVKLARWLGRPRKDISGRPGERLAEALQSLGPSFIKAGQGLATRPDLISHSVAADLAALQDRLPPFPVAEAMETIEAEFQQPVSELFAEFRDTPVAAASIAQVHFATTSDGREVAVKVLRPGIEARFARDFESFFWLADKLEARVPQSRRLRPKDVVRLLNETVRTEMDLRLEAAAASELAENMAEHEDYRIPLIDWQRTSRRVMTMERVKGIPIHARDALVDAGHDPRRLACTVVQTFLWQATRDGMFHADLHPGNLFVDEAGRLVAVDFGIMGRLDRETRRYLAQILLGILNRDYTGVAVLHFEAGYVPERHSVGAFAQALRSVAEPIIGRPVQEISLARLLGHLFAITGRFDMPTQPQLLLLQKTMVMVEGVAQSLDPEVNMWEASRPVLEAWGQREAGLEGQIIDAIDTARALRRRLPGLIDRLSAGPPTTAPVIDTAAVAVEMRRMRRLAAVVVVAIIAAAVIAAI